MEPWSGLIVVAAVALVGYVAQRFGWIDLSDKSKTSGSHGSALGIGDEVFAPSRYEAQIELDRQTVLPAPAPLPGDLNHGIYDGQVTITLANPEGKPDADQ